MFDYHSVPQSIVATLAVGLPDSSRIKRKESNIDITLDQMLLAGIADSLNSLIWGMADKRKRGKHPESILKKLLKTEDKKKDDLMSFASEEEYEAWRARKRKEWNNG